MTFQEWSDERGGWFLTHTETVLKKWWGELQSINLDDDEIATMFDDMLDALEQEFDS